MNSLQSIDSMVSPRIIHQLSAVILSAFGQPLLKASGVLLSRTVDVPLHPDLKPSSPSEHESNYVAMNTELALMLAAAACKINHNICMTIVKKIEHLWC